MTNTFSLVVPGSTKEKNLRHGDALLQRAEKYKVIVKFKVPDFKS